MQRLSEKPRQVESHHQQASRNLQKTLLRMGNKDGKDITVKS